MLDTGRFQVTPQYNQTMHRYAGKIKLISIFVILIALLVLARGLPIDTAIIELNRWVDCLGFWCPLVFGLAYVIAAVLLIPGSTLTLAAGALFGLGWGVVTVSVASTAAAAGAFLIARYIARDAVAAKASRYPVFKAVDDAIAQGGWKIVAMLRLSPLVPFSVSNYLFGLTAIRFVPYVVTSWIAMLPGVFMYIYIGHVATAAADSQKERTMSEWVMLILGLTATVAVAVYLATTAKKKLKAQAQLGDRDTVSIAGDSGGDRQTGQSWGAVIWASVAVVAVVLAACAQVRPGIFSGLFGPPQVALAEAYDDNAAGSAFDHAVFDQLLKKHVDADGWVDYQAIKQDVDQLDRYLEAVAAAPFDQLGRDEKKLAYLINAYNAFTIKLILEYYPIESIKDIPAADRWDAERWNLAGQVVSLNQIEHEHIRPKFREPRIHFALVCAAAGCPPLRPEAYVADRLENQLEQQTHYVHRHGTWFKFDPAANVLHLTSLYDWYGGDFVQVAGSVTDYAARYDPGFRKALDSGSSPKIEWLPYDWGLNSSAKKQPR